MGKPWLRALVLGSFFIAIFRINLPPFAFLQNIIAKNILAQIHQLFYVTSLRWFLWNVTNGKKTYKLLYQDLRSLG